MASGALCSCLIMYKILKNILLPILYVVVASIVAVGAIVAEQCYRVALEQEVEQPVSELLSEGEYAISTYDNVFRRICGQYGVDWRLMSAIAYGESNFRHDAVSPRGAVGLMQVMPRIASSYGVEREQLFDPATNIDVAVRLFKDMERMIGMGRNVAVRDRMAFTLAAYNCGASRVVDARQLCDYYGDDASLWESVTEYLELLGDEEFYTHELVDSGAFSEAAVTIYYVNRVLARYDRYRAIAE